MMTRQFLCLPVSETVILRTYVNSDWMFKPKNAMRIYAKYTQDTIFQKYEMVSTQMSGMCVGRAGHGHGPVVTPGRNQSL